MRDIKNLRKEELTINAGKAQLTSLSYFIPFAILFGVPYYIFWGSTFTKETYKNLLSGFGIGSFFIIIGIVIVGIVVHELIHGLTWALAAQKGLRSMKYGMIWKYLTPYCHCKEPLLLKHYIIGALMPGILLGIIPSILAIITGHLGLFGFGMFFTLAASGDFMIINLLRKEPMNILVQDHPSKIGCYIYRPENE